jgi:hypothetical protein
MVLLGLLTGAVLFLVLYIFAKEASNFIKTQKSELKQEVYGFFAYQERKQEEKAKATLTVISILAMCAAPIIVDFVENHHSTTAATATASTKKAPSDKGQSVKAETSKKEETTKADKGNDEPIVENPSREG